MTIEKLLSLVKNSSKNIYIVPKDKIECEKIQNFLLKIGFVWRGDEHWIPVDSIMKFGLKYDNSSFIKGYKIIYNSSSAYIDNYMDEEIKFSEIEFNFFKKQSKDFVDDLFKDII